MRCQKGIFLSRAAHDITYKTIHDLYQQQLIERLLPILIGLFEQNLKDAIEVNDSMMIFESLRLYQMLFDRDQLVINEAIDSISRAMLLNNQIKPEMLGVLESLTNELLTIKNYVSFLPNVELLAEARSRLQGLTEFRLVYRRIKVIPSFRERIAIKDLLGPNYSSLFSVNSYAAKDCDRGLSVLFTKEGYAALHSKNNYDLTRKSIKDIRLMWGLSDQVSATELGEIEEAILRKYLAEYSSRWQGVLSCVAVRRFSNIDEMISGLGYLAHWDKSPLIQLVEMVRNNTRVDSPDGKIEETLKKVGLKTNAKLEGPISEAFAPLNSLLDTKVANPLLSNIQKAADNLLAAVKQIKLSDNPYIQAYDQLLILADDKSHHAANVMYRLALTAPKPVSDWLIELTKSVVALIQHYGLRYIDEQWRLTVFNYYRSNLRGTFPLVSNSNIDCESYSFNHFFHPDKGLLAQFKQTHDALLSKCKQSLLLGQLEKRFNNEFIRTLEQGGIISRLFFPVPQKGEQFSFSLKPESLDSEAAEFELSGTDARFYYNHGPTFLQLIEWPSLSWNKMEAIFIQGNQLTYKQPYTGGWAWLRFLQQSSPRYQGNGEWSIRYEDHSLGINLRLLTEQHIDGVAPFSKSLFDHFHLQSTVLKPD